MVKNLKRLMLLPLKVILKIAEYAVHAITAISGIVFHLLGMIVLLTAVMCFLFRTEDADALKSMFLTGIIVYCLPLIGAAMTGVIIALEEVMK